MKVILSSVGNPDMGQDPGKPYVFCEPDRVVQVSSCVEASKLCHAFIKDNELGSGNWSGGQIFNDDNQHMATVSYNGRVWDQKSGEEISIG